MTTEPTLLAIEHVAWCVREHISLVELHTALGDKAGRPFRRWEDAIDRLTRIASDMQLQQERAVDALAQRIADKRQQMDLLRLELGALEHAAVLRPPPPFRRREPPHAKPRRARA